MALFRLRDKEGNIINTPIIRGLSAYQIALEEGFEGNVKEWLESLRGPKGDNGEVVLEELIEAVNIYFEENPISLEGLASEDYVLGKIREQVALNEQIFDKMASKIFVSEEVQKYLTIDSEVLI